ncbi:MAG: ABC transporter substrate-binding protein [Candidatus Thorarchaeota archaeon]
MESLTKRILAIVLIVVIGVGIGVGAWFFLGGEGTYAWSAADCPGAPSDITADQIIKVGIIGDTERLQGEGSLQGALLAAEEINTAGGVDVNGTTYYIGIVSENSDEANPILDTSVAVRAAKKLIEYYRVDYASGGFRTEAGLAYQDLWMDAKIIFWNTGAATAALTAKVLSDYAKYKYFFQPSPTNTTALAINLISLIIGTAKVLNATMPTHNITRFSFMREDLAWTAGFASIMTSALENNTSYNLTFTGEDIAFPQDVTPVEMESHWTTIDNAHTQIVIPIISGSAGLTFATSYGDSKPKCVPIGINVLAQDADFSIDTSDRCNYSVTLESVFETNKTSKTLPFWYAYETKWSTTPVYTATGTYDAIYQLEWALENGLSFDPDDIVTQLETLVKGAGLEGAGGIGAYDASHSPVYGWPHGMGLAIQWYNGSKILVPGPGLYPSGLGIFPGGALQNMSPFKVPHWGLWTS